MTKLKLGPLADDKPFKVTVELPAAVHRDLVVYAEVLGRANGQPAAEPAKLIVPMIERFMATDRAFLKARRAGETRHSAASGQATKAPPAPAEGAASGHPSLGQSQQPHPDDPAQGPSAPFFKLATS
jgi:hypothetical protein